ncbi:MAG: PilW family protein [Rhodoferax sp.]|nr:PilW family protein [Rhodoferax sp.]
MCRGHAQRGFSLIELMVGLTIGLMVVLAAIGSMTYTQISSTVVGDSSRLQQTADAVFRNVGYSLAQAGAIELEAPDTDNPAIVSFSTRYTGFDASRPYDIHGEEGSSGAADTLRVSYQDSGTSVDCLGGRPAAIPFAGNVNNTFSKSTTSDDLMCLGWSNPAAQSIAFGVKDFQVWYGVRTGIVPGAETYQFYTANDMNALPPVLVKKHPFNAWTTVRAVRICVHIVGEKSGNSNASLTDCQGTPTTPSDSLLHRVFWRTFTLRNAML